MTRSIRGRSGADKAPAMPRWLAIERRRLDQLNRRIAALIQERFRLADRVAKRKLAEGLTLRDADRERQMLATIVAEASTGLGATRLKSVFRTLFDATRAEVSARSARSDGASRHTRTAAVLPTHRRLVRIRGS